MNSTKLISLVGWTLIDVWSKTLRIVEANQRSWWKKKPFQNVLFSFFHGEQFILYYRHRTQNIGIMTSLSRDGEIQAGILQRFGYVPVRGSSSRGAERALVEMIRLVKKGASSAFAIDGPRGPLHEVKPGILYLAQKTGRPLIPVSTAARHFRILPRTWDKYMLPIPFSKGIIAYGEPISVGADDDIEEKRKLLQTKMEELSRFTHAVCENDDVRTWLTHHPRPKILVVQPSRIGDVVFALPAVAAIRRKYPHAWIGWIVDERCAPVLEGNTDLDEIITVDRKKINARYLWNLRRTLREKNIDLSIDFHGLFKSATLVWLAGARYRLASSSTNGMREFSWLFSREIKPSRSDMHCVERHVEVARFLDAPVEPLAYTMATPEKERTRVEAVLAERGRVPGRPLVLLHPGGGWLSRRWDTERFALLADRLAVEHNAQIVLIGGKEGGKSEKGLNDEILTAAKTPIIDLTGALSLRELAALFSLCDLFVGNEAGPMHMATALGIPAIALLGPTDPKRTGPYGGNTTVLRHEVPCQPCRNRSCASRICIDAITVDEVAAAAAQKLLSRSRTVGA